VICEQCGISREQIRRESRLVQDLHIDSLEIVELFLAIEETFEVTIPDDVTRLPFITGAVTVADLARIVQHQWGTGEELRKAWFARKTAPRPPAHTPFMQLGGVWPAKERCGALYDEMAPLESGCRQVRRRSDGMRCLVLPSADVEIGCGAADALPDAQPTHTASISAFLIDAEPVSTLAFSRFLNSVNAGAELVAEWCGVTLEDRRRRHFQLEQQRGRWQPAAGTEFQPMILVSWFGANAYSRWAHRSDPGLFREDAPFLPSEAQWEYAARGAKWQRFPWGNAPCTRDRACVGLHTARETYPALLPLADAHAQLGVSPFGLLHMAGNVWHWCRDWYSPGFYASPPATASDPQNAEPTGIRAERGGSWVGPGELAASSYRRGRPPHARGRCLGFRCIGPARA